MRTITFQRSLFWNLTGTIVLLGVLFLGLGTVRIQQSAERIAIELTGRALADTRARVARFLEPVSSLVELGARHLATAGPNLDDPAWLDRFLLPLLATNEQVSGVSLGRDDGRSYSLNRTATGWERRLTDPARDPGRAFVSRWTDRNPEPVQEWQDRVYDARNRPWFTGAIAKSPDPAREPASVRDAIHLSRPYEFQSPEGEYGISAAVSFRSPDGSVGVISFDVLLREITAFTTELGFRESGDVAVLYHAAESDEALLAGVSQGLARTREEVLESNLLVPPSGASDPLLDFVTAILADDPGDRLRPRKFDSGGEGWWGAAAEYTDQFLILAIFPENELLGEFRKLTLSAAGLTLVLVCLVVWRSSRLSRLYARPIEDLADQTERMAGLNFEEVGEVETHIEEIQLLALAQEQMRRSLEALASRREDLLIARWIRGEAELDPEALPMGYELGLLDQGVEAVGGRVFAAEAHPDSAAQLSLLLAVVPGEGIEAACEAMRVRNVFETGVRLRMPLAEQTGLIRSHFAARPELHSSRGLCVAELDAADAALAVLSESACPVVHFELATGAFRWVESGLAPERIELAEGDTVLLLTESVLRVLSPDRACFGREGLEEVVRAHAREDAETLARSIGAALEEFTGGTAPERDRTLLVVRRVVSQRGATGAAPTA